MDPLPRVAAVRDYGQESATEVSSVEVEDILKADGSILETPVSGPLFTVASIPEDSCRLDRHYQ